MLTILLGLLLWAPQTGQVQQYLQNGLAAEEAGHYEQALEIWAGARETLPTPSLAIARQFIRLATEQTLREYYEKASEMYFWGLSGDQFDLDSDVLATEIEFLEPLAGREENKQWEALFANQDPSLYGQIRLFWQQVDPTPATEYNERLIEHWERIAYSREHFTRSDHSVYGTDERAPFYLRYGEPDERHTGRLHISDGKIRSVIREIFPLIDPNSPIITELSNAILSQMNNNSSYEVWVYYNENENMLYELSLIFGETPTGSFERMRTVEDFIPNRAFTLSKRYGYLSLRGGTRKDLGLNPGIIMQWIFYEEFSNINGFFGDSFTKLTQALLTDQRISPITPKTHSVQFKQKHTHQARQNLNAAPQQESTYRKRFPSIPLEVRQYRLLDASNRPVYATLLESRPRDAFLADFAANQDSLMPGTPDFTDTTAVRQAFSHYELLHGVQLRGPDYHKLGSQQLPARLIIDGEQADTPSGSAFVVPYAGPSATQVFYAELRNHHPQTVPPDSTPFPKRLRGLGKVEREQPKPLNTDPGVLEMSDLVLGYQSNDYEGSNSLFPFVVATDREVPEGQALMVHAEVYHLAPAPGGIARFELSYQIKPKNFLGWTKERAEQLSLTLHQEVDADRWAEDLQIQTRKLDPGAYVLRMQVTDRQSGQQANREVHFRVTENPRSITQNE